MGGICWDLGAVPPVGSRNRWMSAATVASGDRVLASISSVLSNIIALAPSSENVEEITGDEFYQHPP